MPQMFWAVHMEAWKWKPAAAVSTDVDEFMAVVELPCEWPAVVSWMDVSRGHV